MANGRNQLPCVTSSWIRLRGSPPSNFRPPDVFLYSTGRSDWTEWLAAAKKGRRCKEKGLAIDWNCQCFWEEGSIGPQQITCRRHFWVL